MYTFTHFLILAFTVYRYCPDGGYYTGDYPSKDPRIKDETIRLIQDGYDCLFNVLDFTDHTGHLNQFSPENEVYVEGLSRGLDMSVEMIESATSRETFEQEDWLFAITTDHGGIRDGHGSHSIPERTTFIYTNKSF